MTPSEETEHPRAAVSHSRSRELSRRNIKVRFMRLDQNANKTNRSETFGMRTPKETASKAFIHMIT